MNSGEDARTIRRFVDSFMQARGFQKVEADVYVR